MAHIGLVMGDGPFVVPTLHARDGDQLLLHGSTGSRWMRALADGAPVCVTVSELSALVVARSAFESGVRYASAAIFGRASVLSGAAQLAGLELLTDRLLPGRTAEVRRPSARELAATMVLAIPLEHWSLKVADGFSDDDPTDVAGPAWAGALPLLTVWGDPQPAPDLRPGIEVPGSVRALLSTD
ncbi:MAG: pyridoxamine 5'-phosphate oxidase family protein [Actinobacteria bacterium]|nr:pyridoxamine 5'-phosphate oxidase family protein [Actinomycetota bacterium]